MKRGFTIFLLALFLLNVLGYYGIFLGLEFKNQKEMRALFDDADYLPLEEITVKIPITVPYASDSREFTRVDGEFEYNGEVYRMIKQRLISDTLHIVCVVDAQSKDIKLALKEYVKTFSDKPLSEKGSTKTIQNFIKDYISCSTVIESKVLGWNNPLSHREYLRAFESLAIQLNSPPPRA